MIEFSNTFPLVAVKSRYLMPEPIVIECEFSSLPVMIEVPVVAEPVLDSNTFQASEPVLLFMIDEMVRPCRLVTSNWI